MRSTDLKWVSPVKITQATVANMPTQNTTMSRPAAVIRR